MYPFFISNLLPISYQEIHRAFLSVLYFPKSGREMLMRRFLMFSANILRYDVSNLYVCIGLSRQAHEFFGRCFETWFLICEKLQKITNNPFEFKTISKSFREDGSIGGYHWLQSGWSAITGYLSYAPYDHVSTNDPLLRAIDRIVGLRLFLLIFLQIENSNCYLQ